MRDEFKYVVSHEVRESILERWRRHLRRDPHTNEDAVTPILSQYYDSPNLLFYEEKMDGVGSLRSKVRLRTYGTEFRSGQATFLEIKQRLWDRVRKVRQRVNEFALADLNPERWRFDSREDESAFRVLQLRYRLRPSAQVWYLREAYECTVESDVRVTFDSCLTSLFPGERLTRNHLSDPSRRCMRDDQFIFEVKATNGVPPWVVEGVKLGEMRQVPVPKYVMAVERLQLHKTTPSGVYL